MHCFLSYSKTFSFVLETKGFIDFSSSQHKKYFQEAKQSTPEKNCKNLHSIKKRILNSTSFLCVKDC